MSKNHKYTIKTATSGQINDNGNSAVLDLETKDGSKISLSLDAELIPGLIDTMSAILGKCRGMQNGGAGGSSEGKAVTVKGVETWEIRPDDSKTAILLGGRHLDGETTYLPIPHSDIDGIFENIKKVSKNVQA